MINLLLVGLGIIIMSLSILYVSALIRQISEKKLRIQWRFLFFLIGFFLAGYIIYLYLLLSKNDSLILTEALVSSIFFLGAIFVLIVLRTTIHIVKTLNEHNSLLSSKNNELENLAKNLEDSNHSIEETKKELDRKNEELQSTLEDFYTLRINMLDRKSADSTKIKKENIQIKKKIESIKKIR